MIMLHILVVLEGDAIEEVAYFRETEKEAVEDARADGYSEDDIAGVYEVASVRPSKHSLPGTIG